MSSPLVSVVIATRNRPELVRKAIASVVAQDYAGEIEVVLVFDQSDPDLSMASEAAGRTVRVVTNERTPGLAGARNTGVGAARGEWVAFCDDDDWWRETKISRQVAAADAARAATWSPAPSRSSTRASSHRAGGHRPGHPPAAAALADVDAALLDLRVPTQLPGRRDRARGREHARQPERGLGHPAARERAGPDRPRRRPARRRPWGTSSFFSRAWETKVSSLHWMLASHPDIETDRKGAGRVYGQIAFGEAGQGNRTEANALGPQGPAQRPHPVARRGGAGRRGEGGQCRQGPEHPAPLRTRRLSRTLTGRLTRARRRGRPAPR